MAPSPADALAASAAPSREQLLHSLYEAAELEHDLMCTYLYAAYSLRDGAAEGLDPEESTAVARWRRTIVEVAIAEMGHLVAVWNVTSALGGTPRFGRTNFPLDPGLLPAGVVVKLAPFSASTLQHFVHLERPAGSQEPDGDGFLPERAYVRAPAAPRLTPMGSDYATVGEFYATLAQRLAAFVAAVGEDAAFCGYPALQLGPDDVALAGARPVRCLRTALAALDTIVTEGEGAPADSTHSHFQRFLGVRREYEALRARNPAFEPALPAATNPVLRRPPCPEGRVWIEDPTASAVVDLANAGYQLMLRLLGHAYATLTGTAEKGLAVDLAVGLMRATTPLGEAAARLPAGASSPGCHAGLSFTALRDAAPLPAGRAARVFTIERLGELSQAGVALARSAQVPPSVAERIGSAARQLAALARRAEGGFTAAAPVREHRPAEDGAAAAAGGEHARIPAPHGDALGAAADAPGEPTAPTAPTAPGAPETAPATPRGAPAGEEPRTFADGVETVEGRALTLAFEAKRCIHARFCVTGAPRVFLANVPGAWIHPDAMDVERLVEIAHACPSGAISYRRRDGRPDESAPPVNLAAIREAGPYAFRGDLHLDGVRIGTRATLCRCGASRSKPYCDGSHHDAGFVASGEPPSGDTAMPAVRDGPLRIDPQVDGPLSVRGNLEITSGTGRVVARLGSAQLCRCGGSRNKPFCDGTHAAIGFRSG